MKTALIVIATGGERYWRYIIPLIDSAARYFLAHDVLLFTDSPQRYDVAHQFKIDGRGYPGETLHRYHTVLTQEEILWHYDHVFYCDVDMLFIADVKEEILSDGITATRHAGYVNPNPNNRFSLGTWEERPQSTACVSPGQGKVYYAGGFNGGTAAAYIQMAHVIRQNVNVDSAQGIVALWHDESHLNCYLRRFEPAKILSPSYCYPEPLYMTNPDPTMVRLAIEEMRKAGCTEEGIWGKERYVPKLLALEKRWRTP